MQKVLSGHADQNIDFDELRGLLTRLGFTETIRGDHHIFRKQGVRERINIQPRNGKAKAYQVEQIRVILKQYGHDEHAIKEVGGMDYKYRMELAWSERDQAWIVRVPELPGALADGPTPEAAIQEAQIIIQQWIETAQADGDPIPPPQFYQGSYPEVQSAS